MDDFGEYLFKIDPVVLKSLPHIDSLRGDSVSKLNSTSVQKVFTRRAYFEWGTPYIGGYYVA